VVVVKTTDMIRYLIDIFPPKTHIRKAEKSSNFFSCFSMNKNRSFLLCILSPQLISYILLIILTVRKHTAGYVMESIDFFNLYSYVRQNIVSSPNQFQI